MFRQIQHHEIEIQPYDTADATQSSLITWIRAQLNLNHASGWLPFSSEIQNDLRIEADWPGAKRNPSEYSWNNFQFCWIPWSHDQ